MQEPFCPVFWIWILSMLLWQCCLHNYINNERIYLRTAYKDFALFLCAPRHKVEDRRPHTHPDSATLFLPFGFSPVCSILVSSPPSTTTTFVDSPASGPSHSSQAHPPPAPAVSSWTRSISLQRLHGSQKTKPIYPICSLLQLQRHKQ